MKNAGFWGNSPAAVFRRKEIHLTAVPRTGRITVAVVYPNRYWIGMSNLGVHCIYSFLNAVPDFRCERWFYDPRSRKLLGVDGNRPLPAYDILAFSVSYEPDYVHLVDILRQCGLWGHAVSRAVMPLVLSGGAVTFSNPRPLAGVSDAVFCGEAEESLAECLPLLRMALPVTTVAAKRSLLSELAAVPGVYVSGISSTVPEPRILSSLDAAVTTSAVLTELTEFSDTFLIELSRGCPWNCGFCVTGARFGRVRYRSAQSVLTPLGAAKKYTRKIGLVAAAVTDYPHIEEIIEWSRREDLQLSVSSLRVETVRQSLLEELVRGGQRSVTFAPEAGSERLRRSLHKNITDELLLEKTELAAACGMRRVKLYFMMGLPEESADDLDAITRLTARVRRIIPVRVSLGIFVPKPHTALGRAGFVDKKTVSRRMQSVKRGLSREGVTDISAATYADALLDWRFSHADQTCLLPEAFSSERH